MVSDDTQGARVCVCGTLWVCYIVRQCICDHDGQEVLVKCVILATISTVKVTMLPSQNLVRTIDLVLVRQCICDHDGQEVLVKCVFLATISTVKMSTVPSPNLVRRIDLLSE